MRNRNLLLTVLNTTATKREARQYIQKYGADAIRKRLSVFRISGRSNYTSLGPQFGPGLGRTLSYMKNLGTYPIVVLDSAPQIEQFLKDEQTTLRACEKQLLHQARLLQQYIEVHGSQATTLPTPFEMSIDDGMQVKQDWLFQALQSNSIPILLPTVYDRDTNEKKLHDSYQACQTLAANLQEPYVMDKLIFIDPLGGLPSQRRQHAAHVLVNLKQEYGEISAEIRSSTQLDTPGKQAHLANLDAMQSILSVPGSNTSGIITDAHAAGSMLDRNPIIYNLLTERPLISPSLPLELERANLRTSVVRSGFPVYTRYDKSGLDLRREAKVGNVNLTKLERLINASFNRELDMAHYLRRLGNNLAGIVIVGDYDGAAIITWETAPLTGRRIAYLDKLAVDPSSQGAQGVADIMLIQMLRRLFPEEMLWRSRSNNPVNKWYFERSKGHMKLHDSPWTMFWMTQASIPPVEEYESLCRSIEPSLR